MIKILLICVLVVSVFAQYPRQCRRTCRLHGREICASENRGLSCHRISRCHFLRENCRRRLIGRPRLTQVTWSSCRELRPSSSGACARRIRRPRAASPDCRNLRCVETSQQTACYRSKSNTCRLLTNCQQQRVNCERGHQNRIEWTDRRQCVGMKAGQRDQTCKPIPRRG